MCFGIQRAVYGQVGRLLLAAWFGICGATLPNKIASASSAALRLESSLFTLDGVPLKVTNALLPGAKFETAEAGASSQVAAAQTLRPYSELTVVAVPFGTKPGGETVPLAAHGAADAYRSALRSTRDGQGGVSHPSPTAKLFGAQFVGSVAVVNVNLDGAIKKPTLVAEWVAEAGSRLWIVRASQELQTSPIDLTPGSATLQSLNGLELTSTNIMAPSTLTQPTRALPPAPVAAAGAASATTNLPNASWWNGDCDTNYYASQASGRQSYRLGAVFLGMPACGPRPDFSADNPPTNDPVTHFFGGAWGEFEWECVELSMRYMYLAYGTNPYNSPGGKDVVWNYPGTTGTRLTQISNGTPNQAPQPGDVLSYGPTATVGHTSVVMSSSVDSNGNGNITVIEENNSASGSSTLTISSWTVTGGPYAVSGWLHKSGSSQDTTPPDGSITSPSTGSTVTSGTVHVAGVASDGQSGLDHAHFTANYSGSWHQISSDFTSSPFAIDWDMCGAGVLDGGVTLGLDIWDKAGNIANSPHGTIQFTKSYNNCNPQPGAPTPTGPVNGSHFPDGTNVTLSWNSINGADSYTVEVTQQSNGGVYPLTVSGTSLATGSLAASGYTWHVRAHSAGGDGPWSNSWGFTIDGGPPPGSWQAEYYSDTNLGSRCGQTSTWSGPYVFGDWADNGPISGCNAGAWGARFTRTVHFAAGNYSFGVGADDWARIYVNSDLVVNNWNGGGQHYQSRTLSDGDYTVKVEYANTGGLAWVSAWWTGPGFSIPNDTQDSNQWYALYWGNQRQSWDAVAHVNDGSSQYLSHNWGSSGPGWGLPSTQFSARYVKTVTFACGLYHFHVHQDDGAVAFLDNAIIAGLNQWHDASTDYYADANVTAGSHLLRLDYYQDGGGAAVAFDWSLTTPCPQPPSAPVLQSPASGATVLTGTDVVLTWATVPSADSYVAELTNLANNSITPLSSNSSSADAGVLAGANYSWRVKAHNSASDGTWSDTWRFTVSQPGAPVLSGAATLQTKSSGPINISVYQPGTTTRVGTSPYTATLNNGSFQVSLVGITPGIYDIVVKDAQSLSRKASSVSLVGGTNGSVSFGVLLAGDADNNDKIDLFDYNDVVSWFGKSPGDPSNNPDFDGNGVVDIFDYNWIITNFGRQGPLPAAQ